MAERKNGENGFGSEFASKHLPMVVVGFEGIKNTLELFPFRQRTMLDLGILTQRLPPEGRQVLERAIWEVVEIVSVEGVIPQIVEIDRDGNPV